MISICQLDFNCQYHSKEFCSFCKECNINLCKDKFVLSTENGRTVGEGERGWESNEKMDKAEEWGHMTFIEAAETAKEAQPEELWLTHFSPALPDPTVCFDEARAVFPDAVLGTDGLTETIRFDE